MSLKTEIMQWQDAIDAYDNGNHALAITKFQDLQELGAKIYFNMGMVYFSLGRHEDAAISFANAVYQDKYLAVAYFQRSVAQWILKDYKSSLESLTDAIEYLRDNAYIDYRQLGLKYKLYSFEVFFNRALCFLYLGDEENARLDLVEAQKDVKLAEHTQPRYTVDAVLEAFREGRLGDYMPFVVPMGVLYKPHHMKVQNADPVDYLGKGKVIASINAGDQFVGFTGPKVHGVLVDEDIAPPNLAKPEEVEADLARQNSETENRRHIKLSKRSRRQLVTKAIHNDDLSNRRPSEESSIIDDGDVVSQVSRKLSDASLHSTTSTAVSSSSSASNVSGNNVRIKCHYGEECRAIIVPKTVTFEQLVEKISGKFGVQSPKLKYRDEDGELILMTDQEDLEMALQTIVGPIAKLNLFIEN